MPFIAADIGSSKTRLATSKKIVSEESYAAIDPADSSRVLAFGEKARMIVNASEAHPVRGGVADITLTALMLRRFAADLLGSRSVFGATLLAAIPGCAGPVEREALMQTAREAGFSGIVMTDSLICGALGAGLDPGSQSAGMLVDIGRERTDILVFANGGVITERSAGIGSSVLDRRIRAHIANEHGVLVGARAAERIKQRMGAAVIRINGRDCATGLPASREIRPSELRRAADPCVELLCREIAETLMNTPPEATADIAENGVTLIGGGALRFGLAADLEKKIGVPVRAARNAEEAVILGAQQRLLTGRAGVRKAAAAN
ncbi:MAG: rod shape-determining protein [Clostridiales bacterium]|nr:rod shape-determining protein [Clostridiales bacterium]